MLYADYYCNIAKKLPWKLSILASFGSTKCLSYFDYIDYMDKISYEKFTEM